MARDLASDLLESSHHKHVSFFFFSSRRRHTRFDCDWSSDVCSSDLFVGGRVQAPIPSGQGGRPPEALLMAGQAGLPLGDIGRVARQHLAAADDPAVQDRKSTRLNSSHSQISYAVFCLKKKRVSVYQP